MGDQWKCHFWVPVSVDDTSLHMPLSMISVTCTPSGEGSVFVIPPSKRSQSPIVFGRVQPRMSTVTYSSSDSEPPQFSIMHGQRIIWWEKWGTIFSVGKAWTLERDDMVFYGLSCRKRNQQIIMIKHAGSWDMLHRLLCFHPKKTNLFHHIPPLHLSGNQMSVWGCSSKSSSSRWLQSINWSMKRIL